MGKYLVAALFLLWVSSAFAMDGCGVGPCAKCHSLSLKEANELLREVGEVKKVEVSPVNGLWLLELERDGRKGVAFLDFGKKNVIAGTIFPLTPGKTANQATPPPAKKEIDVAAIPVEHSIVMGNPAGKKRLFVFTDPECPYCATMHGELKKLIAVEPDLAIYVKMFPLRMHPGAFPKARVILGSKSAEMLDNAFSGKPLPPLGEKDARKPVDDSIRLGESLGVNATPTLILPDGNVVM